MIFEQWEVIINLVKVVHIIGKGINVEKRQVGRILPATYKINLNLV